MDLFTHYLSVFNNFMWGFPILFMLVGTGLYLTIRLRFIQISKIGLAIRYILFPVDETGADGDVSSFHALAIAMASTIGTGNIIGVALAVSAGGPGALFWMWLTGLIGMPTKYAECMLSVKYRIKNANGTISGGPMFYLERGLKNVHLARSFAFLAALSSLIGGTFPQSNSMVDIFTDAFRIPPIVAAIGIGIIVAYIIKDGIQSIARIAGIVIPFIAVFFVFGAGIIIIGNAHLIPAAFKTIFQSAFNFHSATGGFLGSSVAAAINHGVRRGVFSNEQGNGTSPIAAATAITHSPVRQGLINMMDVFIDTHIINVMMGLLIVMSGAYEQTNNSLEIVNLAFHQVNTLSALGEIVITISLIFFAFTTIISWNYYGTQCSAYLLGQKGVQIFNTIFIASMIIGGIITVESVFQIADASIALMVIPNVIGLIMLSPEVIEDTKNYFNSLS